MYVHARKEKPLRSLWEKWILIIPQWATHVSRNIEVEEMMQKKTVKYNYGFLVPFSSLMRTKLLAFVVFCNIGPVISVGSTVTKSSPLCFAYDQASFSAIVLEKQYQFCMHLEPQNVIR